MGFSRENMLAKGTNACDKSKLLSEAAGCISVIIHHLCMLPFIVVYIYFIPVYILQCKLLDLEGFLVLFSL